MKFETSRAAEYAFQIIDERIRTVLKSKWGKSLRVRSTPVWVHRSVEQTQDGNRDFTIRVRGTFRARDRDGYSSFSCDMIVRLEKQAGSFAFRDIDGQFEPS